MGKSDYPFDGQGYLGLQRCTDASVNHDLFSYDMNIDS